MFHNSSGCFESEAHSTGIGGDCFCISIVKKKVEAINGSVFHC